ncbi:IS256 family transposase [Shewanella marisflavi]|uniref:IS256 family transposase n=1 Tax=Shewanella marisflavi TaxID=260364 RepID=UPI00200D30AA|nr:IS256 family transposase [Shewanella marisflavi]
MRITDKLIDQLLVGCNSPDDIFGEAGLLKQLTNKVAERALNAEMEQHLGYAKHASEGKNSGNSRNGMSTKTVRRVHGEIDLDIPRDRNGSFIPQLIKKGEKQLGGFDDRIISLYARGMTTRDIQAHFEESYGVEVSATFISQVTNEVLDEVKQWQQRPLDSVYPVVYLDCLVVRSRDSGAVQNKSVYLALGINTEGEKELLGLWMAQTEGAKFWLSVMNELRNRGVQYILIACVNGLKGFPEAIEAVFPKTQVQLCIVHQIRHSLRYVSWKQRKAIAADLKRIYGAATLAEAEIALTEFAEKWDDEHPTISLSWRNNWEHLSVFFDYPPEIRKVIYTTNAIESLNASLRKITKTRRSFPTDDAVMKILYLALHQISKKWTMPIRDWKAAMSQFMIIYSDRVSLRQTATYTKDLTVS